MHPAPFPRAWLGQTSAVMEAPVDHSEPIATPTKNRNAANDIQSQASALRPVISE
jgi:hypothetical protein